MAILHVIDVARVAHDAFARHLELKPWVDLSEVERNAWQDAVQATMDVDSTELQPNLLGLSVDHWLFFQPLVKSLQRFVED